MSSRLAVITDVHADVHALRDALATVRSMGCGRVVCAGDLVDYGLFPDETIALLRRNDIPCIRGNHDRWAVGKRGTTLHDASGCDLSRASLKFLAELPSTWSACIEGVKIAAWHARPKSDMEGVYPDQCDPAQLALWLHQADADVLIVGHTHLAFALTAPRGGLVVNPGALLRDPAEPMAVEDALGDSGAGPDDTALPRPIAKRHMGTFGVLHLPERRWTVHRAKDGGEAAIYRW